MDTQKITDYCLSICPFVRNFRTNRLTLSFRPDVHYPTNFQVEKELALLGVTHVICVTGRTHGPGCNTIEDLEGGADKVFINVMDNMYR